MVFPGASSAAKSENQAFEFTQGTPVGPATAVSPFMVSILTPGHSFSVTLKTGVAESHLTLSREACKIAGSSRDLPASAITITAARPAARPDDAAATRSLAVTLPTK